MENEQGSLESTYARSAYDSSLQSSDKVMPPNGRRPSGRSVFGFNKRAFLITGIVLSIIVLLGGGSLILTSRHNPKQANQAASYRSNSLSVQNITPNPELELGQASQLTINGQLKVTNGIILAPTTAPTSPTAGQLYFDQATSQPYYYSGSQFVGLAPQPFPAHVTSVGGISGNIGVGNGLQITNSGQLSLAGSAATLLNVSGVPLVNTVNSFTALNNFSGGLQNNGHQVCDNSNSCQYASASGSNNYIQNGTSLQLAVNFDIQSALAGNVGGVIQAAVGQTADLLQLQNSSGTVLSKFDANGKLSVGTGISPSLGVATFNGSVGIGTTSPTSALTVVGDGNFSGNLQAGTGTFNGNVGIGTANPSGNLDIYGGNANGISMSGATSNSSPIISAVGSDTNINLTLNPKGGTGGVGTGSDVIIGPDPTTFLRLYGGNSAHSLAPVVAASGISSLWIGNTAQLALTIYGVSGGVNRAVITGATTGNSPTIAANGSDTNVNLTLQGKGIGNILLNPTAGSVGIGTNTIGTNNKLLVNAYSTIDNLATAQINTNAATNKGLVVQGFASQTGDLFQAQSSSGAVLASINAAGNLSVKSAAFNGTLTVNGHIITGNSSGSTTATVQSNAGSTATCSVSGNDTSGKITIVSSGTGQANGAQCIVNFANLYGSIPSPVLTPTSDDSSVTPVYTSNSSAGFTINYHSAPITGQTYTFDYFNAQ